jgi:hypothetical protein
MQRIETAHVIRRIPGPALAADIVVEVRVAIGDDIESGDFLIALVAADVQAYAMGRSGQKPRAQVPVNTGLRFAMKALRPSL